MKTARSFLIRSICLFSLSFFSITAPMWAQSQSDEAPIPQSEQPSEHPVKKEREVSEKQSDTPVQQPPEVKTPETIPEKAKPSDTDPENHPIESVPKDLPKVMDKSDGVALFIGGEEVFRIKVKLGPYDPERRIESIEGRLKSLEDNDVDIELMTTKESGYSTDIVCGSVTIMTVTDLDANAAGSPNRQTLAQEYAAKLKEALRRDINTHSLPQLLLRCGLSVAATITLVVSIIVTGRGFLWLYAKLRSWKGRYIHSIKFQKAVLLSGETFTDVLIGVCRLLRLVTVLFLVTFYLTVAMSFFPETKQISLGLVSWIGQPIVMVIWPAIISYLPNVAFILLIVVVSYYVLSFTRFIFGEMERGTISFPGFDPEWADPTYKIVRFLLISFALVLIFPYLPGSGSPAFQQVSLFIGILISLGSSGAISHVVAGVFLTYTGAFKLGDRVKIADTVGDVVEKTLLATRVRTIKNEYITIPNGMVLGSHIINYSTSAQNTGLILHTTVTIGYDVPWNDVYQLLIDAAVSTKLILDEPKPFVLQTSLDDFYVSYQINAFTSSPHLMAVIYSELHQNIQDKFNQAGVEIMSPHYSTLRDGNQTTIPSEYLDKNYSAPPFVVATKNPTGASIGNKQH